jgi:glucose-1-phosphate thymidylyltransferase
MSISGIILAGGTGSRLWPLTELINKHLLPVYNKNMIMYPLKTLIDARITEIMIVSGRENAGQFLQMLGSGKDFGVNIYYSVQESPSGIAGALALCERFAGNDNIVVILGDNIYENKFDFSDFREGARLFLKEVEDPERFGVAEIQNNKLISIEEKPKIPKSNLAVTGLYIYDNSVFDRISCLKPSLRGELEISDVNSSYIKDGKIDYKKINGFWSDMGTYESLYRASTFVRNNIRKGDVMIRKGDVMKGDVMI